MGGNVGERSSDMHSLCRAVSEKYRGARFSYGYDLAGLVRGVGVSYSTVSNVINQGLRDVSRLYSPRSL
jgi:hypothetical protein